MTVASATSTLETLSEGFGRAASAAPHELVEVRLRLAGRPVRFRIAGRELARLILKPLAPMIETGDKQPPHLEIGIWDGEATGVGYDGPVPEEMVFVDSDDGPVVVGGVEGAVSAIDRPAARIFGWRRSAAAGLVEEYWRPLPLVLPFWYLDQGLNIVHAGMASRDDEGVLIVGPSGAGKSTTSLSCAAAGLRMVGDDQVAIEADGDGYRAHMLYGTGRLDEGTIERNPFLANGASPAGLPDGKLLISLPPDRLATNATARGIVVLKRGAERSAVTEATPGEALLACAPYSLVAVVGGASYGMARIAEMVRRLPLRRIEVAGGPEEAADLVASVIDEVT
jgi:hypothetical protein